MESKVFEIRDRLTFYAVLATKVGATDEIEEWYVNKCGLRGHPPVIVTKLSSLTTEAHYFAWEEGRTLQFAHRYIAENFDNLKHGGVIDVEFLKGETSVAKISLREEKLQLAKKG